MPRIHLHLQACQCSLELVSYALMSTFRHLAGSLLALGVLAGIVGCGTTGEYGLNDEDAAYATTYLTPDGRVVADGRAPKRDGTARSRRSGEPRVPEGYWNDDGAPGAPSVTINLTEQKAFFYKGGRLVGMSPVSTGREGYRTPAGQFRITQKNPDHVSNLYGNYVDDAGNVVMANVGVHRDARPPGSHFEGAPMPYFMRLHGAVGMHGGYLPGYAASHGCIRMPVDMAEIFFQNAPEGTPVRVVY